MIDTLYLEPGDFQFGTAPLRLSTLLGSCVTVTLWHPRLHVGGMCHIQLPQAAPGNGDAEPDGRFADDAFRLFDRAVAQHGAPARTYVAKLFGGGNMFPDISAGSLDVGVRNIEATRHLLAARGLQPSVEHVGGAGHRKLVFDLGSGNVWLAFKDLEREREAARV